ncbi:MAG: hypothetical protein RR356_07495 [Bacteroidales bacterium]
MKKLFIFIACFCFSFLYAQRDAPLRVELETAKDASDYNYAAVGEKGVFVFYEGNSLNKDSVSWVLMQYDTNLQKISNFSIPLPLDVRYVTSFYVESVLYLLFQDLFQKKTIPNTYLVALDFRNDHLSTDIITDLPFLEISKFKAVEGHLLISTLKDKEIKLFFYNIKQKQVYEFKIENAKIFSDEFIEIDTFNRKILLGLGITVTNKNTLLALFETDYNGNLLQEKLFPELPDYFYNSARLSIVDSLSAIIIGTYNTERDKYSGNLHTGVYTLPYINSAFGNPDFYNYLNLKNKDSLAAEKNKKSNLNLQLLVGPLYTDSTQFALVTEVFYPEYNYNTTYSNDPYYYNGSYQAPMNTSFAGYRYVNAYVTTFDKQGRLLWDFYFPFSNMLTYRLINRVSVYFDHQDAIVYYLYNTGLTSTLLHGYEILERINTINLETGQTKDVVEYSRNLNIEKWYGNNFLITGYQAIKNNGKSSKSKRYVFLMDKVIYR